jgi:hypothetical protein
MAPNGFATPDANQADDGISVKHPLTTGSYEEFRDLKWQGVDENGEPVHMALVQKGKKRALSLVGKAGPTQPGESVFEASDDIVTRERKRRQKAKEEMRLSHLLTMSNAIKQGI